MAVNVSIRQFEVGTLAEMVRDIVTRTRIVPRALEIEITESLAATSSEGVVQTLHALRALGVTASLDDYSTGQSSLARLSELPLQTLKLDRSLVTPLGATPAARAMVESTVQMAHTMHMRVVAEGVEMPEQCAILREMGCNLMQGYLFSRLVPDEAFELLLAA